MNPVQAAQESGDGRHRRYEIGKCSTHPTVSFLKPGNVHLATEENAAKRGRDEPRTEKRAIWIVHGMGQQVPFETLDSLVEGVLLGAARNRDGWQISGPPRVVTAKFLDSDNGSKPQVVQRVEIDLEQRAEFGDQRGTANPPKLQLHLYEAYWAPLTEGVAKVTDVISFLFNAGIHGLLNWLRPFRRAMFPDDESSCHPEATEGKIAQGLWNFHVPFRTVFFLTVALLLILSLIAIDAVIAAASAAHLMLAPGPASASWDQLTAIASAITSLALTFGALLFLAEMSKPADAPVLAKRAASALAFGMFRLLPFLRPSQLRTRIGAKNVSTEEISEVTDPLVESLWSVPKWIIKVLSWVGLAITTVALLAGACCLLLLSSLSKIPWLLKTPVLSGLLQGLLHVRFHATTFVSTSAIIVALALCVLARLRRASKRARGEDHRADGMPLLFFSSSFLLLTGLFLLLVIVQLYHFDPRSFPAWLQPVVHVLWKPYWVWPSLLALSKLVRDLLIQYPGDVAIYVSPNKVDRFNEVRQKIKQCALDSLMAIYSAYDLDAAPGKATLLYSKVAIIGHSLGSVVAYDTLNKLLTLDDLLPEPFHVAERTCIFETFGSPLDKTAFFFTFQGKESLRIREQLAASVQPLIQSYAGYRKFPWINVHSSSDIVSGELNFYDVNPRGSAAPATTRYINNISDPDSIVPLIAHVEYWKNPTIWSELFTEVTRLSGIARRPVPASVDNIAAD